MTTLSIVIPTILSSQALLKNSLESAINQKIKPTKIVVFLNGVDAPSWLNYMALVNNNLFLFHSKKLLEPHDSWSKAVSFSDTSFTFVLGDDDILDSDFTETALVLSEKHDLVNFQPRYINDKSSIIGSSLFTKEGLRKPFQLLIDRYRGCLDIFVPGLLFKTSLFDSVSQYPNTDLPVSLYSDVLLFFRMAALNNGAYIYCKPLWSYRRHLMQLSFSDAYREITIKTVSLSEKLMTTCLPNVPAEKISCSKITRIKSILIVNMSVNLSRRFFGRQLQKLGAFSFCLALGDVLYDIIIMNHLPVLLRLKLALKTIRVWISVGKKWLLLLWANLN